MHMPPAPQPADRVAPGTLVMTRDLGFWLRTLTTSVRDIRARGGVDANYTWSGVLNPYIWATATDQGRAELRTTLQQLQVGMQTMDLLVTWWQQKGVADQNEAAAWLRDRAVALQIPASGLTPYTYLPARLQEDVMTGADAAWMVQIEVAQPGATLPQQQQDAGCPPPPPASLFTIDAAHTRDDGQLVAEGRWRDDGSISAEQARHLLCALRTPFGHPWRVGESLGARGGAGASAGRLPLCTRAESVHTWSQRPFLFPSNHLTTRAR